MSCLKLTFFLPPFRPIIVVQSCCGHSNTTFRSESAHQLRSKEYSSEIKNSTHQFEKSEPSSRKHKRRKKVTVFVYLKALKFKSTFFIGYLYTEKCFWTFGFPYPSQQASSNLKAEVSRDGRGDRRRYKTIEKLRFLP